MNPHEGLKVPNHVPEDWRIRYGGARVPDQERSPIHDRQLPRRTVIRLLIWLFGVTTIAAAMMWPATRLPSPAAAAAFVAAGGAAGLVFARWVLPPGPPRHDHVGASNRRAG